MPPAGLARPGRRAIPDWGQRTYVMGIINLTPDSFAGDGLDGDVGAALERICHMVAEGADIVDLGAQSTRPGSQPISEAEELDRLVPVLGALRDETTSLISVDTSKASVAAEALRLGADLVNDVTAMRGDAGMLGVAREAGVPVVLMHNSAAKAQVSTENRIGAYVTEGRHDQGVVEDVVDDLGSMCRRAVEEGLGRDQIIVDPGIGFGKTPDQNLKLINRLDQVARLGFPVLIGVSRKSFIGRILDAPPEDRLEGTAAAVALGIARGANIVRVHDVRSMVRVSRTCDAILRS